MRPSALMNQLRSAGKTRTEQLLVFGQAACLSPDALKALGQLWPVGGVTDEDAFDAAAMTLMATRLPGPLSKALLATPSSDSPSVPSLDSFRGCLVALALADAFGAPHEGGFLERLTWRLIATTAFKRRWTDDTQMTLDIAHSLIEQNAVDPDDLARRFSQSYKWSRGYGPGAAAILRLIKKGADWRDVNRKVHPSGSFGNGAAMRAPPIGLFYCTQLTAIRPASMVSAVVTHAHSLGLQGAASIALATALAATGVEPTAALALVRDDCLEPTMRGRLDIAVGWSLCGQDADPTKVVREFGNGNTAVDSCVTALHIATRFADSPFEALLRFTISCRGDVDTIGAMAGAIWGARNGFSNLPPAKLRQLEALNEIIAVADSLHDVFAQHYSRGSEE